MNECGACQEIECEVYECGVCQEIVFEKEEALQCDGKCTKWHHCIGVRMSSEQYETYRKDYVGQNVLQWLCDGCKEQNKENTQSEMHITWGKMKDVKKIRKSLDSAYQKIVKWKKKLYANPKRKSWKNTNCRSDSSHTTL